MIVETIKSYVDYPPPPLQFWRLLLVLHPITGSFYAPCHLHTSGLAQLGESSKHRIHCHDHKTQNQT